MPQRYSRHYYDLYRMAQTSVKDAAFARVELLKTVVDFKMKFYPRAWAKCPEAVPGTLKLIPPEYRFGALSMKVTFCGHSEVFHPEEVRTWLYETVEQLIRQGVDMFLLGGYGALDRIAASVEWDLKQKHSHVQSVLVKPYLDR